MNPTLWLVTSAIGAAILVALAIVYRRAAAQRAQELVDEELEAEYASLEGDRNA